MWLLLLSLVTLSIQQRWDASQYPNPRKGGFKQCNMRSASSVCDPDEVLSIESRYRLNNELQRIGVRTEKAGTAFCDRKGSDAVLAIVRAGEDLLRKKYPSRFFHGSQQLVNDLGRLWHLDDQCKKGVVFLLSSDDRHLYFSAQPNAGFNADELQSIIDTNAMQLQTGNFVGALGNIFKEVGRRAGIGDVTTPTGPHFNAGVSTLCLCLFLLFLALCRLRGHLYPCHFVIFGVIAQENILSVRKIIVHIVCLLQLLHALIVYSMKFSVTVS
ncbi:hypothetical protein OSTOST_14859 [Ostertagia ostertagi]